MNTEEHLDMIVAFCERNLAIAEKRTQGEWALDPLGLGTVGDVCTREDAGPIAQAQPRQPLGRGIPDTERTANAQFIATCAGASEAGWLATITTINGLRLIEGIRWGYDGDCGALLLSELTIDAILAAYPIELIKEDSP